MWAAMSCTAAPRMEEIMENQSLIHREANCLSRFDRLPVKSEMLKIIAVLAAVSVVEAFDLGLIGQTVLVLKQIWNLGPAETGLLATCSTIGVVLGTFSCGFLSDRYGRKRVLFWAVFIFTVFTFMGPLMENFYWVVAMRFLSGLGSGAVFPIPYLYISELVGAKQRGVTFAYCNSILVLSYVLPSSFGAWAVATFPLEVAWKLPFLVGGLPIVMLYFIHKYMPESPRWLMRHNRHDEAEALVERLESSLGMEHDKNYMDPAILTAVNEARSGNKPAVRPPKRPSLPPAASSTTFCSTSSIWTARPTKRRRAWAMSASCATLRLCGARIRICPSTCVRRLSPVSMMTKSSSGVSSSWPAPWMPSITSFCPTTVWVSRSTAFWAGNIPMAALLRWTPGYWRACGVSSRKFSRKRTDVRLKCRLSAGW